MKRKYTEEKSKKTIEFPANDYNGNSRTVFRRVTLGSLLIILFMTFYVPSLLNWISGAHTAQDVIRNGTIEEYISAEAVIVREEELLEPSPINGRYIAEIGEGDKAAAYSHVAMVMGSESGEHLQQIEEINAKIVKARMEQAEKADFFSADLAKLDDEIGKKVKDLIVACNSRSFEEMGKKRSEIRKIVEKKAEIAAGSSTDGYISSLQKQKEAVQDMIDQNTLQVKTGISGIVSYKIDGYEGVLTPDKIKELNAEELEMIRERCSNISFISDDVQEGLPFVKIIKGIDIYMVAEIPSKRCVDIEEGDSIAIRINSTGFESYGTISHITSDGNDRTVIAVRMSRGADILSSERVINVDFITKTEEGLKVPLKCLRDVTADGTRGRIVLVRYNVAASRLVDILCRDEEYAIIRTPENEYERTVNLYNIYLINPDNIEEGDIVGK